LQKGYQDYSKKQQEKTPLKVSAQQNQAQPQPQPQTQQNNKTGAT